MDLELSSPNIINIVDVTARDGLQNEERLFSTREKLELIRRSLDAGAKRLEVASFAHPKYVPQMADAEAVIAGLPQDTDEKFIGLAMNERGVDRGLNTDIGEIGLVVVATDTFAQKNQNQTRQSSVDMACQMINRIKAEGRDVNVTIAASFGCPFEGEVEMLIVREMVDQLAEAEPHEISLADTIGVGNPWHVTNLFTNVIKSHPEIPFRAHFHNTRNTGLANVYAAVSAGVQTIDVSIAGIGGCPFAPAATGNVPAEDVVYMLERNGLKTGMSLEKIIETAHWLSEKMGHKLPGMVSRAGIFPKPINQAAE
jgi:hydroxymethylglutaryl-CoA lyase